MPVIVNVLSAFFRATPWALPLTGLAGVVLLAYTPRLKKWSQLPGPIAWCAAMSVIGFLTVTVTPSPDAGNWGRAQTLSMDISLPIVSDLLTLSSSTLNVWLAVPMGLLVTMAALQSHRYWMLASLVALPLASELIQFALPVLGRSAFLLTDVVSNWLGAALGAFAGTAVWLACNAVSNHQSPAPDMEPLTKARDI